MTTVEVETGELARAVKTGAIVLDLSNIETEELARAGTMCRMRARVYRQHVGIYGPPYAGLARLFAAVGRAVSQELKARRMLFGAPAAVAKIRMWRPLDQLELAEALHQAWMFTCKSKETGTSAALIFEQLAARLEELQLDTRERNAVEREKAKRSATPARERKHRKPTAGGKHGTPANRHEPN